MWPNFTKSDQLKDMWLKILLKTLMLKYNWSLVIICGEPDRSVSVPVRKTVAKFKKKKKKEKINGQFNFYFILLYSIFEAVTFQSSYS